MNTKHRIEFKHPGSFFPEESYADVETRNPLMVVLPKSAFAFRFYDATEQTATLEDGTEVPHKTTENYSQWYYPDAELFTQQEVKKMLGEGILLSNMQSNDWDYVIKTRCGNFQPYDKDTNLIAGIKIAS